MQDFWGEKINPDKGAKQGEVRFGAPEETYGDPVCLWEQIKKGTGTVDERGKKWKERE